VYAKKQPVKTTFTSSRLLRSSLYQYPCVEKTSFPSKHICAMSLLFKTPLFSRFMMGLSISHDTRTCSMAHVTSKDGTKIVFDQTGEGQPVVIVGGTLGDRSQQAPVAAILSERFKVFNYDRRGHGESGFTDPYSVAREIEDLEAIINEAGGSAFVYGTSGCAVLALEAAAQGVSMKKLALWEPPYIVDDSRPPVPHDYQAQLTQMLAEGRRGDMVELFMTKAVGMPAEFVAPMRSAPWWLVQEAIAHTLVYDAALMGDYLFQAQKFASVTIPTLVIDGGTMAWASNAAQTVAVALPNAQRRTLAGQPHNVDPAAIAPALAEFFAS
jgi:pimeloyl-ACP methyl ester carboxylesterase